MRASHAHAIASPPASVLALATAWHGATAASALQRVRTRVSCPAMTSFCARVDAVRIAICMSLAIPLIHRLRGPCQACSRDAHDVGGPPGAYLRSPPTTTATPTMDLGLTVAQTRVREASMCMCVLVDERPSQPRRCGTIMCWARVPRESAHFERMFLHDGSHWWSLHGDGPEGLFQRLHGAARARDEHVRACVTGLYV